jgi:hypothetical protein
MMTKTLWLFIFVFAHILALAQTDTLYQDGKYYNANIFVYNPEVGDSFSIHKIIVNEDTLTDDLATNGIEVDFSTFDLEEEDPIEIKIIYDGGYEPTIVNPEALKGQQNFRFSRPKFYKGHLQWRVSGNTSDFPISIEQYKWGEWRVVGEVDPLDTVKNNLYQYDLPLHSGVNKIRLVTTNIQGARVVSKETRYTPPRLPTVTLESTKIKDDIVFSRETEYELYDIQGNLLKKGIERYVDMEEYPKGEYWLNYDNSTIQIKKK